MSKRRELGITQSLMFSQHEWRDEELRLHRHDRCRKKVEEGFTPRDDTGFAGLDCADLLDPKLLSEELEPEPHFVIALERMRIDRDEIMARRHYRTWKFKFHSWF